jgi:integrase
MLARVSAAQKGERCKNGDQDKMTIRTLNKLTARGAETAAPGRYGDGGGLYLCVGDGRRSWVFRYTSPTTGKVRETGLGAAGAGAVALKQAREERDRLLKLLRDGLDPLEQRRIAKEDQRRKAHEAAARKTVAEAARAYVALKARGWGHTSVASWTHFAKVDIAAVADLKIEDLGLADIERVVAPLIEQGLLDKAQRAQARLQALLDFAVERGWRPADKRSRWRRIAPNVRRGEEKHHPMVEWRDAPPVLAKLRASHSISALALEFTILSAARAGEALGATFAEFDLDRAIWTIPAKRMKMGVEHVVPLSERALAIVRGLHEHRRHGDGVAAPVFPGRPGRPLNRETLYEQAVRVAPGSSIHGWRASFRSWAADHGVEFELAEMALAHQSGSVVQAYQRSAMVERRRHVMTAWAAYLEHGEPEAKVIPLAARRG